MKIKKVLVSQPKPASEKSPYYDIAEKYGVKIDFRPFIKVESVSAKEFRQQKVSILDHTAVIFTSRHAIDHFFHLCTELRVTIPETMKYFCVTEAVALYIQKYVQYRKRKIFFGATGKIEDLIPSIVKHKTEKYLVPMSDVHNDDVRDLLDKNNKYRKKRERCQNAVYRPLNLFPVYYRHAQTGQTVKIKDQIGEIKTASPFISVRAERKQHSRQRIGQYHQRVGHTRNHPKNEPPSQ